MLEVCDTYGMKTLTKLVFFFLVNDLPDPVFCPKQCGRYYRGPCRKGNVNRHLKHECGIIGQFPCPQCHKRFNRKDNLKTHRILVHQLLL